MFPVPEGQAPTELPPPIILKIVSVIQPAVLVTLAVLVGVGLAHRVGLNAPTVEAAASGQPFWPKLRSQLLPGILVGVVCGVAIITIWVVAKPQLSTEFVSRAEAFNKLIPSAMRFLYGGLTEEVLLRWGFMTFLVWLPWRLFQNGEGSPKSALVVAAIFISALVFGAGHLPIASMLAGELTFPLAAYVVTANSLFGIAAGFLYWKRGLESAMIAHIAAHVVLILAIAFSL